MKQEDFERLKAVCEKEGFEIGGYTPSSRVFVIDKKDIWDGVEFLSVNGFDKIYKIKGISNDVIFVEPDMCFTKSVCKPSTEQAYIEQLKNECFERFGEIKEGDGFQMPNDGIDTHSISYDEFKYIRESDSFYLGYVKLYQQGKWATKLPERVKVELLKMDCDKYNDRATKHTLKFLVSEEMVLSKEVGKFLAERLEKYLNDEIK